MKNIVLHNTVLHYTVLNYTVLSEAGMQCAVVRLVVGPVQELGGHYRVNKGRKGGRGRGKLARTDQTLHHCLSLATSRPPILYSPTLLTAQCSLHTLTISSSLHLFSSSRLILFSCFLKYFLLAACRLNQV